MHGAPGGRILVDERRKAEGERDRARSARDRARRAGDPAPRRAWSGDAPTRSGHREPDASSAVGGEVGHRDRSWRRRPPPDVRPARRPVNPRRSARPASRASPSSSRRDEKVVSIMVRRVRRPAQLDGSRGRDDLGHHGVGRGTQARESPDRPGRLHRSRAIRRSACATWHGAMSNCGFRRLSLCPSTNLPVPELVWHAFHELVSMQSTHIWQRWFSGVSLHRRRGLP